MTVVIKQIEQTEIYLNEEDDVVIYQHSARGDDPSVVIIPPQYLGSVIDALYLVKHESEPTEVYKPEQDADQEMAPRGSGLVPHGDVRLTANIRKDLHLKLKIEAAKRRTTVGELIEMLAQRL